MNASQVRDCLAARWPDSDYLLIPEAPERPDRGGRRIDLLVVALWQSRGLQRDAVEIKVSYSDWTREKKRAEKADFWWRHSHRFWVAVPAELAAKVTPELPVGWGLLACEFDKAPVVVVKPTYHDAEALTWPVTVGLLRASADCGVNALRRAESRGRDQGFREGVAHAEKRSADGAAAHALKELRDHVAQFEEVSGLSISDRFANMKDLGSLVRMIREQHRDPSWAARSIGYAARDLASNAEQLLKAAKDAQNLAATLQDAVNPGESEAA